MINFSESCFLFVYFVGSDRIDWGIKSKGGDLGIFLSNVNRGRRVIGCECDSSRSIIVKMGEGNFILSSDGMSADDFVDVIKLVPILIEIS
jgi:hypothetical protein